MDNIGAEVSQKMRSAIKAKLMELDCYVDDELPDYIMVMVANKRSKSQMNEDLQLFLTNKTSTFVDWLHIVLKKLKEVHVTNPDVYAKAAKRKSEDDVNINIKVKKEKKEKKFVKKLKDNNLDVSNKSLTDDLPITANKLSEVRKIIVMQNNDNNSSSSMINDDGFDIPLLSEVNLSNEKELALIEKRIKSVKNRLGIQVDTESEDEDFINIKAEPDELFINEKQQAKQQDKAVAESISKEIDPQSQRRVIIEPLPKDVVQIEENEVVHDENNIIPQTSNFKHARITFESNKRSKKSVLERLGKRRHTMENLLESKKSYSGGEEKKSSPHKLDARRSKTNSTNKRNDKDRILQFEKPRENVLSRLGIMSKVSIPDKPKEAQQNNEDDVIENQINREVPSVVKVKPRILPPNAKQANKTLLLKAVADAQRSIAQTPNVGNNVDKTNLFTKKLEEKPEKQTAIAKRKLLDTEKTKLKNIIVHIARDELKNGDNQEYVPQPIRKTVINTNVTYVPTSKTKALENDEEPVMKQKFIVTLDGIDKEKFLKKPEEAVPKKPPSPIIFDKTEPEVNRIKSNVPDLLPVVSTLLLKNRERCKYWPLCKQGEKCEFIHPTILCKMFPNCKFGDKCVYIHPSCKFESSCTRRDCPYSHTATNEKVVASRIVPPIATINVAKQTLQICKYFPNCINIHCTFYHPKPCKFGKYCKNQSECNFSHTYATKTANFTWRSSHV